MNYRPIFLLALLASVFIRSASADIPSSYWNPVTYQVYLKSFTGNIVCCEDNLEVNVNRTNPGPWENLSMVDLNGGVLMSGDTVTFKSWKGYYLCSDYAAGNKVFANRQNVGIWERFVIYRISGGLPLAGVPIFPGDQVSIRSFSGQWLCANYQLPNVRMTCDRWNRDIWETFTLGSFGYNKRAAANYALAFAYDRPSRFPDFGQNDCTNFGSQVLYYGGMPGVFGNSNSYDYWFYNNQVSYSISWIRADGLVQFLKRSGRTTQCNSYTDLDVGDFIVVDWVKGNGSTGSDGIWDHIMIVTEKLPDGKVRLSYHSNNRQNFHIDDIYRMNPPKTYPYSYWKLK